MVFISIKVLIANNKEDYKRAVDKFKARKTVYIPGIGIDTEMFKPDNSAREKIRNSLGVKDSQTILLSVGELNKNKNHESVIRAIQGMDLIYVIVGKGDLKDKLELVAKENGVDLRLLGFKNDVVDYYNAADVYILPSVREGLNVSLMEAMACGLPVACSDIRGNRDLITDFLFYPTNIMEIKECLTKVFEKKSDMGENNLRTIRSFDLQTVEKKIREIYLECGK